jgi:hypothetical protein
VTNCALFLAFYKYEKIVWGHQKAANWGNPGHVLKYKISVGNVKKL